MNDEPPRLPGEEWRPVVGYEGSYEISSMGRLRSLDRTIKARDGAIQRRRGQLLGSGKASNNYVQVTLRANGERRSVCVHRLVMEAFVGPCPTGLEVSHLNGWASDNRLENLEYTTHGENCRHGVRLRGGAQSRLGAARLARERVEVIFHPWTPDRARAYKRALEEHMP